MAVNTCEDTHDVHVWICGRARTCLHAFVSGAA